MDEKTKPHWLLVARTVEGSTLPNQAVPTDVAARWQYMATRARSNPGVTKTTPFLRICQLQERFPLCISFTS